MKQFDYNLLKVLRVLIETRNTRQASEVLNLSQSAVSHALRRLRESFDDPLFVRERYGLVPTERCYEIENSLPHVVGQIDALFHTGNVFDPLQYDGKISISLSNALTKTVGVELYKALSQRAPNAKLEIMDWTWQVESALIARKIDLALDYGPESYSKQIQQEAMPKSHYILYVREGHPLTRLSSFGLNEVAQYPLALIRTPDWGSRHQGTEDAIRQAGLIPNVVLKSDSPDVNFAAIRNTNTIFPSIDIGQEVPEGIQGIRPLGGAPKYNMDIYAYYLHKTKSDNKSKWLINEVKTLLGEVFNSEEQA